MKKQEKNLLPHNNINTLQLHAYPILNFLILVFVSAVCILTNKNSYFNAIFLFFGFFCLFCLQNFYLDACALKMPTTKCVNAVAIFWLFWLTFGKVYSKENVFTINNKKTAFISYFISTALSLFGLHAHIKYTANNDKLHYSEAENDNLYLFEQKTPIKKNVFFKSFDFFYFFLFVTFPTESSHYPCMFEIEAFLRPLLMFLLSCATLAIKTCNNQKIFWPTFLRETSWILATNVFCLIFFVYQIISLSLQTTKFFSYLGKLENVTNTENNINDIDFVEIEVPEEKKQDKLIISTNRAQKEKKSLLPSQLLLNQKNTISAAVSKVPKRNATFSALKQKTYDSSTRILSYKNNNTAQLKINFKSRLKK